MLHGRRRVRLQLAAGSVGLAPAAAARCRGSAGVVVAAAAVQVVAVKAGSALPAEVAACCCKVRRHVAAGGVAVAAVAVAGGGGQVVAAGVLAGDVHAAAALQVDGPALRCLRDATGRMWMSAVCRTVCSVGDITVECKLMQMHWVATPVDHYSSAGVQRC